MKLWIRISLPMIGLGLVLTVGVAALGNTGAHAQSAGYASVAGIAQNQPQSPSPVAQPDAGGATTDAQEDPETVNTQQEELSEVDEAAEAAALADKAVIGKQQAIDVALAANPSTTLITASLDNENGMVVYSVELSNGSDVKVDATTGQITSTNQVDKQMEISDSDSEGIDSEHNEQPTTPSQP